MAGIKNEVGKTYGSWTVISRSHNTTGAHTIAAWHCACPVGHERRIVGRRLRKNPPQCQSCKKGQTPPQLNEGPSPASPETQEQPSGIKVVPAETAKERHMRTEDDRITWLIEEQGITDYLASLVRPTDSELRALRRHANKPGLPYEVYEQITRFVFRVMTVQG